MRGFCVSKCEDGLQMARCRRFMDEQWLCNVNVRDERETPVLLFPHCDQSVSTLQVVSAYRTPFDCLSISFSLGDLEQKKDLAMIMFPLRNESCVFYSVPLGFWV